LSGNTDKVGASDDDDSEETGSSATLKRSWIIFASSAAIIFLAAPLLAFSSEKIAEFTGISQGFVGVLAVAIVTTLPEFTSAVTSFRIGAADLGVGALFGSNAFNIAALGVADLFYTQGSLFSSLDSSHIVAGTFAIILMVLALIQLIQRRPVRIFSFKTPSPVALILIYVIGVFLVFRMAL
jgi:cation:H+ antiporter